ncbi:sulfite exporter TauE/SafE family protein [Candidatus Albibeggiatoa sp. nov. BB20]|uniref:sulfite exporter TauE/SafE family protein n=1 Tax=Candidatus Albibeggiatoa sp. nov. BB20 TaxID=3162723 RepID=UPI003365A8FA
MEVIISLLILGIVAGILAGLLGVGGGLVIVPVIVWIFGQNLDFPAHYLLHIAIGTSLATIVVTAISSIIAHQRHGAIHWDIVRNIIPGLIVGALLGAVIADALPHRELKIFFAIFVLLSAIKMLLNIDPPAGHKLPKLLGLNVAGTVIGSISAIVGIGGGTLTVPFLTWCNVPIRNAVATSSTCGLPIALAGAVGFIVTGWGLEELPEWSLGYVYLPAFIAIVPTSMLFAPVGAKLAHTIPIKHLKRVFAILLCVVGIQMLLS